MSLYYTLEVVGSILTAANLKADTDTLDTNTIHSHTLDTQNIDTYGVDANHSDTWNENHSGSLLDKSLTIVVASLFEFSLY